MSRTHTRPNAIQMPSRAYQGSGGQRSEHGHHQSGPSTSTSTPSQSVSPTTPRPVSKYNSLRSVVSAVSSQFRANPHPSTPSAAAWQTTPWSSEDFPILDDNLIASIWSGEEEVDKHTRKCVAQAVQEMQLNWSLDPKLVGGERSEGNMGYAAIVAFLQRVARAQVQRGDEGASRVGPGVSGDKEEEGLQSHPKSSTFTTTPARTYERHDLLRAIERQDHESILNIRNANFDLLLESTSSASGTSTSCSSMQTPLGYAISLGPSFVGTAIVLTGALSKYVNTLPDEQVYLSTRRASGAGTDFDPRTMERLRKLRGTLKLAVDHSLATDQTSLLSSYVQVLFMSSGTGFITDAVNSLCSSLRACFSAQGASAANTSPTDEAREIILQFVNHSLKKREKVAAVSDLVDNAAGDLVVMALWELVRAKEGTTEDEELTSSLPTYAFARDERVTGLFIARVGSLQAAGGSAATPVVFRRVVAVKDALQGLESGLRRLSASERIGVLRSTIGGK